MARALTATDILTRARNLITEYDHWTQGYQARDEWARPVATHSKHAVSWCSVGAVTRVTPRNNLHDHDAHQALNRAASELGFIGIIHLNDNHEDPSPVVHERVLTCFDKAIELAKEEPS